MLSIRSYSFVLISVLLVLTCLPATAQKSNEELSLGSIDFPTSATGEVQKEFLTGVLALHSFWYPEARDHFRKARELNPDFAMAYWGEALTHDHPIWEQHDQAAGKQVLDALDKRIELGSVKWTEREKAYVDAVRQLFDSDATMDERRNNYADAMKKLAGQYPEDDEALVLSGLAEMSRPGYNYSNPDVRDVVPIAAKLEDLYQRNPKHPGAMHYLIHVYDSDKFAELGLRPADDYSSVAYSSSHAIHMPSHVYKQLGMWQKMAEANIQAYEASVDWQQETNRPLNERDFHAYRWLFDAYIAMEKYAEACDLIIELEELETEAESRDEDLGRIPSTKRRLKRTFEDKVGSDIQCSAL